jgi:hypothetical protein
VNLKDGDFALDQL